VNASALVALHSKRSIGFVLRVLITPCRSGGRIARLAVAFCKFVVRIVSSFVIARPNRRGYCPAVRPRSAFDIER
jgi:hypothetical protein